MENKTNTGIKLLGALVAFKAAQWAIRKLKEYLIHRTAQNIRQKRDSEPLEAPPISQETEQYILSLFAYELADAIKAHKVSSVEATTTYIKRAFSVGRALELTAEEPFTQALELAKLRDQQLNENPESCGPLHGVPISIKDHIGQKGCHSSSGVVKNALVADQENASILECLLDSGAVPFIRSTVPQLMYAIESANHIYGRACNPWNVKYGCGGSSGGEAGLIAGRCSVLGIGSDRGGSIRIPCGFCGVYGIMPSYSRISIRYVHCAFPEDSDYLELLIPASLGPIGKCVEDLTLVLKTCFGRALNERDPFAAPLPFNVNLYENTKIRERMRIGFYTDIYYFECSPPIRRAVLECKKALQDSGHELIEYEPLDVKRMANLFARAFYSLGNRPMREALDGEVPMYFNQLPLFSTEHTWITKVLFGLLKLTGNKRLAEGFDVPTAISIKEFRKLYHEILEYIEEFTNHWKSLGLDAVICPILGTVTVEHTKTIDVLPAMVYSFLYNVVRCPAGVVPITTVQPGEDTYPSEYEDLISKLARSAVKGTVGNPVCIQVVGLPFQDEVVLGVMAKIESLFSFHRTGL